MRQKITTFIRTFLLISAILLQPVVGFAAESNSTKHSKNAEIAAQNGSAAGAQVEKFIDNFNIEKNDKETGGHIMYRHVGKSNDWLEGRLFGDKKLKFASSYSSVDVATNAIKNTLKDNQDKIILWLNGADKKMKLAINKKFDDPIGISMSKKEDYKVYDAYIANVILKRSEPDSDDFYVLTSYPMSAKNDYKNKKKDKYDDDEYRYDGTK